MRYDINPFPRGDADRYAIWEMLVHRDIDAFLACDWSMVADDFTADRFWGVHAHLLDNPDSWRIDFPSLAVYRDEWLRQCRETADIEFAEPLRPALFRTTSMRDIDINGDKAFAHKKFDGQIARADGSMQRINWQTLYFCTRIDDHWQITGFIGYLPHPLGST